MKIAVDKIPEEGLDIEEKIDPQSLSLDLDAQGILFKGPIDVNTKVTKTAKTVFVDGEIVSFVEYTCARCLVKFNREFKKPFKASYAVKEKEVFELDEDIRQELIVYYPMKALCMPDCKGLCRYCGQDLNVAGCGCK